MITPSEQLLLRIYLRTTDQSHFVPTYQRLVQQASAQKLRGATVLKGILGFGESRTLHDSALHFSENLPAIVEIVDSPAAITNFIATTLSPMLTSGLATLERAHVLHWQLRSTQDKNPLAIAPAITPLSTIPSTLIRSGTMQAPTDGLLLRIFIGESDTHPAGEPLYKLIVNKARELGLKGATVLRGSMGFGANSVLHTAKVLELSSDLPIVIEIVDQKEKIEPFLPFLESTVKDGMITMEDVRILAYRPGTPSVP
jgi:uncharacterized protein